MKYEEDLKNSLRVLNEGGVILYPTETIWGLGCDATNNEATERIFKIKNRIESSSLIVLVDGEMMLRRYIRELPSAASTILGVADTPITIIYPGGRNLANGITAEDGSAGIRITKDRFCSELIGRLKKPLVSTSANKSGEPAPSCYDEIVPYIINSVDYVVFHRREDRQKHKASPVIKIELNGEIKIIRK
jgi:L-threonylcarbamoyladenylate synthase